MAPSPSPLWSSPKAPRTMVIYDSLDVFECFESSAGCTYVATARVKREEIRQPVDANYTIEHVGNLRSRHAVYQFQNATIQGLATTNAYFQMG